MAKRLRIAFLALGGIALVALLVWLARPLKITARIADHAPLAAYLTVRTRLPSRLTVTLTGLDENDIVVREEEPARRHEIALLGLYPAHENEVEVRAISERGERHTSSFTIRTESLPDHYPEVVVSRTVPGRVAPGMTWLIMGHYDASGEYVPLTSAIDEFGRVRWFYEEEVGHVLRRTASGTFIVEQGDDLVEVTMLGEPTGRTWDVPEGLHHDAIVLPDGNLLALTAAPGSYDDGLVEIDRESGEIVRAWDYRETLDEERPRQPINLEERDWLHLNAVAYDGRTDAIIVSGRDQSAVVSIGRADGALRWIIGDHEHWEPRFERYLLEPVGEPFEWQWGQHAPMAHPEDSNRVLIYDNGNKRSYSEPLGPEENYSRAVEYRVDPEAMTIRQLWQYGAEFGSERYTPFIGDADYLENGNRLVTFGGITRTLDDEPTELFDYETGTVRDMKISALVVEVTDDLPAEEVLAFSFSDPNPDYRGYRVYRAFRMPLYP